MTRLAVALATAGVGFARFAPGTWGAAIGVGLYLLVRTAPPLTLAALVVAVSLVGVWAAGATARHLQREDPGAVVIDEIAGQLLTFVATGASGWGVALGFGLFRVFDITKPWPVRQCETLHGGVGIMADDLMAGLYANLALQVALRAVPGLG